MSDPEGDPLTIALKALGVPRHLTRDEARSAIGAIVSGGIDEVAISALLVGLRVKGETDEELAGAVDAVRGAMRAFHPPSRPLLDTCGTGGDGAASVNVSTASAIVVASSGVAVAKHGNRSASGVSGSSQVLEELGVTIDPRPGVHERCLAELGIAFFFAPSFHPALKHVAPVRSKLPFRTLFNLIGPLANPARPEFQLVGVPDDRLASLMAQALARLGVNRAAVVTGPEGIDEVGLSGPTRVLWVSGDRVEAKVWEPAAFGLPSVRAEDLRVSNPVESAALIRRMLDGEPGPVRSIVLANASAALMVAGKADSPSEGVALAAEGIDSGRSSRLLDRWIELSRGEP